MSCAPRFPIPSPQSHQDACGYSSLEALDDDRFLAAYSDFRYPMDGDTRKAILVREVTITGSP